MPDGYYESEFSVGRVSFPRERIKTVNSTAYSYDNIFTIAAGATLTDLNFTTGGKRAVLEWFDVSGNKKLSIAVNGSSNSARDVKPVCVTSEIISSIHITNSDSSNAQTLRVRGFRDEDETT